MPKKYKVLITGSSGMLGVDLCKELGKNYELIGVDVVSSPESVVHRFLKCDITDKEAVMDAVMKARPEIVVHAAAYTDVDGCEVNKKKAYEINAGGSRNVALACKKAGAVLVAISTDFVFDGKKKSPYRESDKPGPISVYGDSKLKGEKAIESELRGYFILRTSWLYGKHGKNFVDAIIRKAETENILRVVDDQAGCPTYTKDLAKALHRLIDKISTDCGLRAMDYGIYHVSNAGAVSWYEYARKILKLAHIGTKVVPISSKELARPARRPAMSVMDCSKFTRFTGYKMRAWGRALKEYLA